MTPRRSSDGYAMLAALLVMALAATFALVVVGAVHSLQVVEGADRAGWRATSAEGEALAAAIDSLRWSPWEATGGEESGDPGARDSWKAAWTPAPGGASDPWTRVAATVASSSGRGRHRDDFVFELRSEPWAMGATCAADADIRAPFTVTGSGVYVGGCLRGRENVDFVADAGSVTSAGAPADVVRGEVFPSAAVHGGAGIYARGVEVHDASASEEFPDDTDRHSGVAVPADWLEGPSVEFLLAAATEATPPERALSDRILRLNEVLPAAGSDPAGGRCLILPRMDEVAIQGSPSAAVGRLLVVVEGDAVVGVPGETLTLSGGLVVTGRLEVLGPVTILGTLHAGSLSVGAPASVVVESSWRRRPLPGAALPMLLACGS